jgi:hypothetical protein
MQKKIHLPFTPPPPPIFPTSSADWSQITASFW